MLLALVKIMLLDDYIHIYLLYLCFHNILCYYMYVCYVYIYMMVHWMYTGYRLVTFVAPMIGFLYTLFTLQQMHEHTDILYNTLTIVPFEFGSFKILWLLRNFFVIKYFPLTAMLNYLTYQVFYIEKNPAFKI